MAQIDKDGIYKNEAGDHFQYLKGHVIPDGVKMTYVAPFPKATEADEAKQDTEPANKAAAKPENKAAK